MSDLAPIPIPAALKWRDFRHQWMPLLIFTATAVCAAILWNQNVSSPTLIGQVESATANVSSSDSGTLTNLWVTRFQRVKAGDVLAEILAPLPNALNSEIQLMQARMGIESMQVNTYFNVGRMVYELETLRLDYLKEKVELATSRVELIRAENELKRIQDLSSDQVVSPTQLDTALRNRDLFKTKVTETSALIDALEKRINEAKFVADTAPLGSTNQPLAALAALNDEQSKLTRMAGVPVLLRAPIDGLVTSVYKHTGENIRSGDLIVTISAEKAERIIAYVRQPFSFSPRVGMPVLVRMRSAKREFDSAQILQVGSQMESITNVLMHPGVHFDLGLPIAVSVPAAMKLRPGEVVDITIRNPQL